MDGQPAEEGGERQHGGERLVELVGRRGQPWGADDGWERVQRRRAMREEVDGADVREASRALTLSHLLQTVRVKGEG